MKHGNWIPLSKAFIKDLPHGRQYTRLEAAYSLQVDYDCKNSVTVAGYSALWSWSRTRVSKFLSDMNVVIVYPEKTRKKRNQKGHIAIHKQNIKETYKKHKRIIENSDLELSGNIKKTKEEHKKNIKGSTTKEPMNLNPKTKHIYPVNYSEKLKETFNNFIENRNVLKKPVTDLAFTGLVNKLNKLSGGNEKIALEIVENSIINGWSGFFALKNKPALQPQKQIYATFED